jgi:ABC-type transporter Mla subunit MlaD
VDQLIGQNEAPQRQDIRELADQSRGLKPVLASVQTSLDRRPDDARTLKASVEGVRQGLDAAKADMAGAIAQISGKLDRNDQATAQKLAQITERLDRLEKRPDLMPVGSIAPQASTRSAAIQALPAPASAQPTKPAEAASLQARQKTPIPGWILRDVYNGIALVEGRGGYREVAVGAALPGAGKVESIERRGRRWVVVTSQGLITEVN